MNPSPSSGPVRSPELLGRDDSRLLVIDMQEKLMAVMSDANRITEACMLLVRGAHLLKIPVSATEQYPKGLSSTVEPLRSLIGPCPEKLRFSSAASFDWAAAVANADRRKVVVCGIEAHVCVLQSVFDLMAAGYSVYVAADAITSRRPDDLRFAVQRMRDGGAVITTAEAVLYEWCETAAAEEFKAISELVKSRAVV